MNYDTDGSVRTYERASDEARRRLSTNLDDLAAALTPGRMVDEVLSYARAGGGDFLKGLGRAASENPIPALLMGVGAAMFLSGKGRIGSWSGNGSGDGYGRGTPDLAERASATAADVGSRVAGVAADAAAGVRDSVASAGASVRDTVANAGERMARTAEAVASQASAAVSDSAAAVASSVQDYAASARGYVASAGQQALDEGDELLRQSNQLAHDLRDRGNELLREGAQLAREQPLVVAALGLALGAAAAALLPRTQTEDELMGEASDSVKGLVGAVAGEQYEKAKNVAGKVFDDARRTAEQEGLSPAAAGEAVRSLAEKLTGGSTGGTDPAYHLRSNG